MERGLRSSVLAAYDRLPSVHMFGADRVRTQLNVHLVALTQIERLGPREKRLPEDVSFPGERRVREGDAVGPLPVEPGTDAMSCAVLMNLPAGASAYVRRFEHGVVEHSPTLRARHQVRQTQSGLLPRIHRRRTDCGHIDAEHILSPDICDLLMKRGRFHERRP